MSDWLKGFVGHEDSGAPEVPGGRALRSASETRYVVIDCETTGLSPKAGDRVVSFAGIEIIGNAPSGRSVSLIFNPGRKSNQRARNVHGLSDHVLRYQPLFSSVANSLVEFLDGSTIVGHNVRFDIEFMKNEFALSGLSWSPSSSICTMDLFSKYYFGKQDLDSVASRFGINVDGRLRHHDAFIDAEITARIFQLMYLRVEHVSAVPVIKPTNYVEPPHVTTEENCAGSVTGRSFAFTGELSGLTREDAVDAIISQGGVWHRAVRKDTDFLVVGNCPGSTKLDIAAARKAKFGKPSCIDEKMFFQILRKS